jgi:predicted TPR repeat methyltransferase
MNNIHRESLKTNSDKKQLYNQWAATYDSYVKSQKYNGPKELIKNLIHLLNYFPVNNNTLHKRELQGINILDFGCGTGLVGEELRSKNVICVLDGIDISDNMIEKAMSKKCYNNFFKVNLLTENLVTIKQYDYIISSGVFLEGHVPFIIIPKLLIYLKSGGLMLLTIRDTFKNKNIIDYNKYIIDNKSVTIKSIQNIDYLENVKCKLVVLRKL